VTDRVADSGDEISEQEPLIELQTVEMEISEQKRLIQFQRVQIEISEEERLIELQTEVSERVPI
jgi:hypothetical protein